MTISAIITIIFFIGSFSCLVWILLPKIATLSSIDIEAIPREREQKAKDKIMYDRLRRRVKEWESFLAFALHPIADFFKEFFKAINHAYTRLSDSREFQKRQWFKAHTAEPTEATESEIYQRILREAEQSIRDERYEVAEVKCIELISKNKDGRTPYNMLVSVYSAQKEWGKARDVAEYLVKVYRSLLKKNDESEKSSIEYDAAQNSAVLSDILLKLQEPESAFNSIQSSLALQPVNPKYLDAVLEIAILLQQRLKAEKYLDQLRSANPENNKIVDFDERIKQLPY